MKLRFKLSIYNTILMSIMVLLVLGFMLYISDGVIATSSQVQLKSVVESNADEIEYDDGELELDDVDFLKNQVTTLIYTYDGFLISGNIKNIEFFNAPLLHNSVTSVEIDNENFLLYDYLVESRRHDDVYVRGIISTTAFSQTLNRVFLIAFLTLPVFIILSGIGSYFICKKSLTPLDRIIQTADDINSSDDLSSRINLPYCKDEIYDLSMTFDDMFDRLEQSFIAEKQFTTDVSHELRTPITIILARCEVALNDDVSDDEKLESFDVINNQANKMKIIVNSLLNLIRLENGLEVCDFQEVDLSELLEIICDEYDDVLPDNLQLKSNIQENIILDLDYSMITRIVSNLIDNAIKYIGDGDLICVDLIKLDNKISLLVKDNGIGISDDNHNKVFKRFYQVDNSRTAREYGSMGLGLAMVRQMIILNKGEINLESELGHGSCFTITFNL